MMNVDKVRSAIVIAMESLIYINVLRLFIKIPKEKLVALYFLSYIVGLTFTITNSAMQYLYYSKTALVFLSLGIITIMLLKTKILKTVFYIFIYAILMLVGNVFAIAIMVFTLDVSTIEIQNNTRLFLQETYYPFPLWPSCFIS